MHQISSRSHGMFNFGYYARCSLPFLVERYRPPAVQVCLYCCEPSNAISGSSWWRSVPVVNEKKRSEETQTLHTGCSKAEPKNFAPPQTPFPGAQDGQNLISWRWSLSLPTNPVWWGSMHAISSYHGNRPIVSARPSICHTPTDRTDYNTLRPS